MSFSQNIWWNLTYPLTVNRIRLSAPLTVICWHLRLGRRLGAFQIHTIRWRHSRLAPLTVTVTVTVSVAFRNVSIYVPIINQTVFIFGHLAANPPFWTRLSLVQDRVYKKERALKVSKCNFLERATSYELCAIAPVLWNLAHIKNIPSFGIKRDGFSVLSKWLPAISPIVRTILHGVALLIMIGW